MFGLTMLKTLQSASIYNTTQPTLTAHNSTVITSPPPTTTTTAASFPKNNTILLSNASLQNPRLDTDFQNSYSKHDKFYVNSNQEVPIKTHTTTPLSLIIILVSLVAAAFIIAGIITALFVMKRRFSILRINGAKGGNDAVASNENNGMLTNGSELSSIEINEKEKEVMAAAAAASSDIVITDQVPEVTTELKKEEIAPESATIESVVTLGDVEEVVKADSNESASTSLIANVLNDLSESVAFNLQSVETEKPPLAQE